MKRIGAPSTGPARRARGLGRAAFGPLLALLSACALPPPLPEGPALQAALQGLWCNSEDGGRSCWAHDRFTPDGRLRMCGRAPDSRQAFDGLGEVEVAGRRMCYLVLRAEGAFWLPPGARYCTEIVELGPRHHRYRDLDGGGVFTLHRLPDSAPDCPAP